MTEGWMSLAVQVALRAGEVQRRARTEGVHVETKGITDVVTDVDAACERVIVEAIAARFPEHGVLAEEGTERRSTACCVWIIDPLDGTKNYAHGRDRCAVSVALSVDGSVVVAVVYAPFSHELFTAERGSGAWHMDRPMCVSTTASLREAMVASAWTYDGANAEQAQLARMTRVFGEVQALRSTGCAALDLADVARGRFDAYFEPGLKPWDTAAGALLVREAGGVVTRFDGVPHDVEAPDMIGSNGHLHEALRARMSSDG